MDIKLKNSNIESDQVNIKNNKKIYIINFIAIIITVIIAMVMIGLYPKIQEIGSKHSMSPLVNLSLLQDLSQNNYVLYKEVLENKEGKSIDASDIYIKPRIY